MDPEKLKCQILNINKCIKSELNTSQLSRINDLSIGQPLPSLKTSQIEFVKDSQSVRSTSSRPGHCSSNEVKLSCFCRTSFCIERTIIKACGIHKELRIRNTKYDYTILVASLIQC